MRRLIRALVEELPCAISECQDSAQALAVCAAQQPEWVLLDLKGDGLATMRQIHRACPQTSMVVVTDDDDARYRAAAREAGACGYVLKENLFALRRILMGPSDPGAPNGQ